VSKRSQGPGWWLASDGLWYSPRQRRRQRPTGLYVGAAVVGLIIAAIGIALVNSSKGGTPAADPVDGQAARACQVFSLLLTHKATPAQLGTAAAPLVAGAADAQAAGRPGPKWATLGGDLIAVAGETGTQDPSVSADGTKASYECGTIPSAAKQAAK
jgi:hypothetical protein